MIKLKCIRKEGAYNGIRFGQVINVEEKNVNEYLRNGFIQIEQEKETKKEVKKETKKKSTKKRNLKSKKK